MKPALAVRHVWSVSACCWSIRSKSGWRVGPDSCPLMPIEASESAAANAAARVAEAYMPQILHRAGGGRGARVRAQQPLAEAVRRVDRRRAVERHQRGGHSGQPHDVGAPPILRDVDDLDQIGASCD